MRDDISDIAASYDHSVEDEDSRLVVHQLEYDLTWRYLARYLPPTGSILEIGAGTGRYTLDLCKRGYSVTAIDLSAALLQRCKLRLEAEGLHEQIQLVVAEARDLHAVVGRSSPQRWSAVFRTHLATGRLRGLDEENTEVDRAERGRALPAGPWEASR